MGFFGSGGTMAKLHDPGNFFGPQEIEKFTMDTLTPFQKEQLNALIAKLSGATPRTFGGDPNVAMSDLGQISLAGLENRALELSDPNFQTALNKQETDTLMQLLDFEGQQGNVNEFFNTNIRDPALESFQEEVLPSIGREFGGNNFFGSERRTADQRASEELIDSLTRSRADINFQERESSRNRALQALGLSTDRTRAQAEERFGIFGAGMEATALDERNISRQFEQFLAEAGLEDDQIKMLLASLAIPQFENIVVGGGSSDGAGAAGAAGAIASMFSDSSLKTDTVSVGGFDPNRLGTSGYGMGIFSDKNLKDRLMQVGRILRVNIYTWHWNDIAKRLGINGPTIGVIAQEVAHTGCVHRDPITGFLKVNYVKLLGVV